MQLRVAQDYIATFAELAKTNNTMLLPANVADVSSMIATAMSVIKHAGGGASGTSEARLSPPSPPSV